jgi:hypothetical protein
MLGLPDFVNFSDFENNWPKYLESLYDCFKKDFIDEKPVFCAQKKKVIPANFQKDQGKELTFWHLITEGRVELERTPYFQKCKRIKWPRVMIDNYKDESIRMWWNERKNKKRVCLCYGDWEYIVVLEDRKRYFVLITAYPIEFESEKRKYIKEFEVYKANIAVASDICTPSAHGR